MKRKKIELCCILTGQKISVTETQLAKMSEKLKFPDVETYKKYYISKDGQKLLKQGLTENEIRRQYKSKNLLPVPFNILKCYVKKFKNPNSLQRKRKKKIVKEFCKELDRQPYQWKGVQPVNLITNKEYCEELTKVSCWRPDIYLDFGCKECILKDNCQCPIKNLKRGPGDSKRRKSK
jgi:hypothetical protein